MSILRILLIPLGFIYGLGVKLRHWLFDTGILKSKSFPVPTIGVGNLSLGGTGKTPVVEYLIRLLYKDHRVATLSRGYGRKSSGFVIGNQFSRYGDIGDEPMQYVRKFGNRIIVSVDESRRRGIRHLLENEQNLEVLLLDDVFQHRYVKPGLSILLTDYHKLYVNDYMLPAGTLRDTVSVARLADIIVVTKAPKVLSPIVRKDVEGQLHPLPHQSLYFSYLTYGDFIRVPGTDEVSMPSSINTILLFTGIANSYPLQEHLRYLCNDLVVINFADHHVYTRKDVIRVSDAFENILSSKKIIVTTEKDAMRLQDSPFLHELGHLPVFYLPVMVEFQKEDKEKFDQQILNYVEENKRNN